MAKYAFGFNKNTTSVRAIAGLCAAAASPRRAKILWYELGSTDTPADTVVEHVVQRITTVGTATTQTPNSLDPADSIASTMQARDVYTVDPTFTSGAILARCATNLRTTFQWYAPQGGEIMLPATANNGVAIALASAGTGQFSGSLAFEEQ